MKTSETDSEVVKTIYETINKVEKENFDRISFFKLQELNRSL